MLHPSTHRLRSGITAMLCAVLAAASLPVAAQTYPTKPVRWVIPFAPGGPTDVVVRVLAPRLGERLGQPVVIENRAGAGGNIGHESVAKAPADGYSLLYVIPALLTNPFFFKGSSDPRDFTAVIQTTKLYSLLVASNKFGQKSVADLIAQIRAKPGTVSCGSSGSLPTVGCELLKAHAGADMIMVVYKGNAPALQALMTGEIDLLFDLVNTAVPQIKGGKIRAIATAAAKRSAPFPDLPALAETIPDLDLTTWQGVVVRAGTPRPIIERLNRDLGAVLSEPEVRKRLMETGLEVEYGSAEDFERLLQRDHKRFSAALMKAGIKPE